MNLLGPNDKATRFTPGEYNRTLDIHSSVFSPVARSDHRLDIIESGVRKQLYLEPGSNYVIQYTFSLSTSTSSLFSNYGRGGIVVYTDNNGVPTITYTIPFVGSFQGLTLTTVYDPRLNKHRLNLAGFVWGNETSHWSVVLNVLASIRV